ncbi:MAG: ABC transporter ATP-binding protein [Acidimicrobiales bacterium]
MSGPDAVERDDDPDRAGEGVPERGPLPDPGPGPLLLEMRGITKRFPGVLANDNVDFDLRAGEVHALLGENGAGKSTLMKILFGLYRPDEGELLLRGERVDIASPTDAINHHIGMVHQHFMLVPTLTVAENVALGLRSSRGPLTDLQTVSQRMGEISDQYGLSVDPSIEVWKLSVGERQRVEIIKALYRDAELLVLDEPTAVLTPQEVDDLFVILRQMTGAGRGLIFISHKLREVMDLSDRITVLRNGAVTGQTTPAETSRQELARMMVGRDVSFAPDKPAVAAGRARLTIRNLTVTGDRGTVAVDGVDLEVRAGEIVGIAGVSGNGQRELAETVAGLRPARAGSTIEIDGVDLTAANPATTRAAGLAYVPEERMRDGAIGEFQVSENLLLINHGDSAFLRGRLFHFDRIREHCQRLVDAFSVKTPTLQTLTKSLSGGNIQKLIMARELDSEPSVVLAAQPTRGVDIGAAEYIHGQLIEQRSDGVAILVISEDLDEILALADRIAVMYEGRVVQIIDRADATREGLGLAMAGVVD